MEPTTTSVLGQRPRSRLALALASGVLLVSATGCSGSQTPSIVTDPVGASTGPVAGPITGGPETENRFQSLWLDMAALFQRADEQVDDSAPLPQSAVEANRLLGLTDESDLRFADYSADQDGNAGRMCLVSSSGVYATFDWIQEFTVFLGDGECSYDEEDATVVGDLLPGNWVKGAALMGDATVGALITDPSVEDMLGDDADLESPVPATETPVLAAAPAREALASDARMLGAALASYYTGEGSYPDVAPAAVAKELDLRLTRGTVVRAYRVKGDSFQICVTNEAVGGFASYDSKLGDVASGENNPADLLDALCGIAPTENPSG